MGDRAWVTVTVIVTVTVRPCVCDCVCDCACDRVYDCATHGVAVCITAELDMNRQMELIRDQDENAEKVLVVSRTCVVAMPHASEPHTHTHCAPTMVVVVSRSTVLSLRSHCAPHPPNCDLIDSLCNQMDKKLQERDEEIKKLRRELSSPERQRPATPLSPMVVPRTPAGAGAVLVAVSLFQTFLSSSL